MNLDHFIYFIETVKHNSFTTASEKLFISQSTISKAIRSLEKEYDTNLIDRTSKQFKLTSAGELFYYSAVKIVSNYQAENELLLDLLKSKKGTLKLGVPPVTITIVYSLLNTYKAIYPDIRLQILEMGANKIYSLAKSGAIDIGILIQPFKNPDFHQIPFYHSDIVCLSGLNHPRLSGKKKVHWSELCNENLCILDKSFMLHDIILKEYKNMNINPIISLESAQWDLLIEAVSNSESITFLPRPIIEMFCRNKIEIHEIHQLNLPWIPTAVYHKGKFLSTPIKLFLDMVKNYNNRQSLI